MMNISEKSIVKAMVTDLYGGFKEIIFPASQLDELINSGVAYDGSSFVGINDINSSDSILKGVKETIMKVPVDLQDDECDEYWIICNILDRDGNFHKNCARSKLIELQEKLSKEWDGGKLYMGSEPESYFVEDFKKIGSDVSDNANYFNPKDPKTFIITRIQNYMNEMGFIMERSHTEVGKDQFESNWKFDLAERTADKIQIYKLLAHKIAQMHGYDVTFLPKPYPNRNGSGMHCHLSVQNDEKNLFYGGDKERKYFSEKSLSFLQGILNNSRAISAIANSAEASYARLVPGFEAPCVIAVGECNRTAACRIPAIADFSTIEKAIRAEFRFPDPLANPYLLAASFIATGLDGIKNNTKFDGFTDENLYEYGIGEIKNKGFKMLPRNLWEAYNEFIENDVLKNYFGENLFNSYSNIILDEINECQKYANKKSIEKHYLA